MSMSNVNEKLCNERRNKLEAEFEAKIGREENALARARFFKVRRPTRQRNFNTYREALEKYGR